MKTHPRDPESSEQPKNHQPGHEDEISEDNLDKTIEDSFPASDPPSSIPDPEEDEDAA
jgi:hypothetical protein